MKVLHFCRHFSRLSETFIYDHITEIERQGEDNHVVTLNRENEDSRPFPKVSVLNKPSFWHPRRLWYRALGVVGIRDPKASYWPQIRDRLEDSLRRVNPDIIHAHFGPRGVLVAPVAENLNIPLVVTLYGYDVSRLAQDKFWREQYSLNLPKASLLLGISNHICSRIEDLGGNPRKIECWHLGVNLEDFQYIPATQSFDGSTVRCLHVGRLVEKKSPENLVRAFKCAKEKVSEDITLRLKIAGDGPLFENTKKEIKRLGLKGDVRLLGAVPHDEVGTLLREANIYTQHCQTASDGDQEGQGVSFVEASASGLPIVATRHNGLPDVIIDGETGYLVEEQDTRAMGKRIAELANQPDKWLEMGRAGRTHIEKKFNLNRQSKKIKKIYNRVVKQEGDYYG